MAAVGIILSLSGVAPTSHHTLLGALADSGPPSDLSAGGFTDVVIGASWSEIEPAQGSFSPTALAALQSGIDADRAAGLQVTLDIGTQYAPAWVFALPGGTRFVDQFGDVFTGSPGSGDDVANAVTDAAVRDAMVPYLFALGTLSGVAAVRLGGGPYNELRYPEGWQGSQPGAFWYYDTSSQATLPQTLRGWTPGTGTPEQAAAFLAAYDGALDGLGDWLVRSGRRAFPHDSLEIMLPGWGQRPGEARHAAADLLLGTPDEVNEGLDWIDMLPDLPAGTVAYSTWADATTGGPTNPDPATYIHSILPARLAEGGESAGNGQTTPTGEALMLTDARRWRWYAVVWNFADQGESPDQVGSAWVASNDER